MNRDKYRVEFEKLIEEVKQPLCSREHLAIWGGTCTEDVLTDFLDGWPLERMTYRIWESTDRIDFEEGSLPSNVTLLERGRLFGDGGDLDLRRDGDVFHWRFVGEHNVRPPQGYDTDENDLWAQYPDAAFHCYEETALLWGKREGNHWHDDRVAAAKLNYPEHDNAERVQVQYKVYSRAGHVEFVWLTGLSEWKEESNA
jgi:hypothetical protein